MAHQVTLEEIAAYNHMRQDLQGKILTAKEVKEHLRNTILPKCDSFVSYLSQGENPALIRVGYRGRYKFPEKPVHISVLQRAFDKKARVQKRANEKWRAKNAIKDAVVEDTVDEIIARVDKQFELNKKIEEAAKLLKQHGWLLKRPKTTYEDY